MAEQLYLAVEHRCDINHIGGTPAGSNNNVFLEMENEKAEEWLKQSAVRTIGMGGGGLGADVSMQLHATVFK